MLNPTLKNQLANRLTAGQQVYAYGTIKYFEFVGEDGKQRQTGCINPKRFYICDDTSSTSENKSFLDINEVKLFGRVTNPPRNTDTATYLFVATHFFNTYESTKYFLFFISQFSSMSGILNFHQNRNEQLYQANYHNLSITDPALREIANKVEVGNKLFVHGRLNSYTQLSNDGTKRTVCTIQPRKLLRALDNRSDEGQGERPVDF